MSNNAASAIEVTEESPTESAPSSGVGSKTPTPTGSASGNDKIPMGEKLAYGVGSLPQGAVAHLGEYQANNILVFGQGLAPSMLSLGVTIFRVWDAITDPIMGWISDRTRTKWGRRRPYMLVGGLLVGLTLPFLYRFNEGWSDWGIIAWFIGFGMLTSTATTIFNVPYQSLKMEMTPDYTERTNINAVASVVGFLFGLVTPWLWWMTQQPFFTGQAPGEEPNTLLGVRSVSMWALLLVPLAALPAFFCKERYYKQATKQKAEPFWKSMKMSLQNKPFRYILAFVLTMNVEAIVMAFGGFLSLYLVMGGDQEKAATIGGFGGSSATILGVVSVLSFTWFANKFSKEKTLLIVVAVNLFLAASVFWIYDPEHPYLVMVPQILTSVYLAGLWLVLPSMQADVVDYDELQTGERREGAISSVFAWTLKTSGTLFFGLSGVLIEVLGFDIEKGANQEPGVFFRLQLALCLIPLCLAGIKAWLIMKYPLTREKMSQIRTELEEKRGAIDMQAG